ncbi:alpha/beta hydrolase [Thermoleptolyngbya sp. M55_K2018_002]|uniref:alpha/beta fold hydrolase n=1 Tax=Thermoleptolyngbya sp. M55_K2018_002 TaxID=2747808 RepID=UPI0019E7FA56|nr:alpha/beta hydrolase [Thermoleptolyngbya sp. M55_K2018_002]HIK40460.1 alpha/beta hydrolase [Thermoleptolyngbya sp. M55_K2018_002]
MSSSIEAIAYHGWGFDADLWQPWAAALKTAGVEVQLFDRGYFGLPNQPGFSQQPSRKVILAHSYGLHLCPVEQMHQADLVLVFSGFSSFHPLSGRSRDRSKSILQIMIQQFEKTPSLVLQNFYKKCFSPVEVDPAWCEPSESFRVRENRLNSALLLQDLQQLDESIQNLDHLPQTAHAIAFHGQSDRIVPFPDTPEQATHLLARAEFISIPNAGHLLHLTHFERCWERAIAAIHSLPPA